MSVTTPRRPLSRRSTLLFDWRAEDASMTARTGQALTFARNSAADLVTLLSTISVPAHVPRFAMVGGTSATLDTPVLRINEASGPRVAEVVTAALGFSLLADLTIYAKHCPDWYATSGGITTDAYLWTIGNAVPQISCRRASGAGTYIGLINTATTDASQTATAPVTRTQEVLVQIASLLTAGTVKVDAGSGLSAASSAATAVAALGSMTLYLGGLSSTGTEMRSGLVELKIASGLYTLAQMRTRS
jgi:hypothetical protein